MSSDLNFIEQQPKQLQSLQTYIDMLLSYTLTAPITLPKQAIISIVKDATKIIANQPNILNLKAPMKVCGDIHGQFIDLLNIFKIQGYPQTTDYLFLGDYVDRGNCSIETMTLLLAYKIKYQNSFFLLRGNHQSSFVNKFQGFYSQCISKYDQQVYQTFSLCFKWLPLCAILNNRIFCVHGGLSPRIMDSLDPIKKIQRPIESYGQGLLCDLLWSDPKDGIFGFCDNKERGISFEFGDDIIQKFLKNHKFELIIRGHIMAKQGYRFSANQGLITLFSAPNYCGCNNSGGILQIYQNLKIKIKIFEGNSSVSNPRLNQTIHEQQEQNIQTATLLFESDFTPFKNIQTAL